ncbi:hypothetical protein [Corynebacterium cystitidis]|uniref:hypothetical protein n=1 Tax=Corynebacterium cystitidis TaxID=35757 RepID=UPI00211DC28D|nr:hypothetical protein [Corynebacterium cystitidis]
MLDLFHGQIQGFMTVQEYAAASCRLFGLSPVSLIQFPVLVKVEGCDYDPQRRETITSDFDYWSLINQHTPDGGKVIREEPAWRTTRLTDQAQQIDAQERGPARSDTNYPLDDIFRYVLSEGMRHQQQHDQTQPADNTP